MTFYKSWKIFGNLTFEDIVLYLYHKDLQFQKMVLQGDSESFDQAYS